MPTSTFSPLPAPSFALSEPPECLHPPFRPSLLPLSLSLSRQKTPPLFASLSVATMSGIAIGLNKGHVVTRPEKKLKADGEKKDDRVAFPARPAHRKGALGKRVGFVRTLIREVVGLAPYEKRITELLKVGKDKRALKLAKKKLGTHLRAKRKREDMQAVVRKSRAGGATEKKK
eukprot:TRINITY_DN36286_c0_g1_i1.p1 TRINITY_DN36286_c0_g1~~TRINITY_DN36286_c0_g1_i1.p1  ORF type:complete len:174 (-),score=35.66 TRINITY_DN36286_c0_g1_i1:663-1184(-)